MPTETTIELAALRFDGKRFDGHALDVDCTQELIAYRALILECAKELWKRKNPGRVRLPKGFEDGFRVQFDRIDDGSAVVPLRRVRETTQTELDLGDEFDEAAALVDAAIAAADCDDPLPDELPANVIPLFASFGRTLRDDEVLHTRARGSPAESAYTAKARVRLAEWVGPTYEDRVDLVGEVRMANVGPGAFRLQVGETGAQVDGRFDAAQEAIVLEALRNHRSARLRVVGTAEFSTRDRQIKRLVRIDYVDLAPATAHAFDEATPPVWEQLERIGLDAPPGTWDAVPDNLSTRIDQAVYRQGAAGR